MRTLTRHRPATKPAAGSVRWALQPGIGRHTHPGCLILTTPGKKGPTVAVYLVQPHADGYRLVKRDGTVYDLPADLSGCDCPDATFHQERPQGCKHMRALRAALAALKL